MISTEKYGKQFTFRLNKERIEIFIITVIGIFSFAFYFFDPSFSVFGKIINSVVIYSFLFILLFLEDFKIRISLPLILLFIYLFIYNYSGVFSSVDFDYADFFFSGVNILFFFAIIYKNIKGNVLLKVFDNIIFIFILVNFSSLFFFVLIFLNINIPYELVNLGGRGFLYRNYFNLAIFNDYGLYLAGHFKVFRLCGIFEEPGMLGTYAGILLAFDFIFFPKKKIRKNILFIYGFLSFSMAFFIFLFCILFYFANTKFTRTTIIIASFLLISLILPEEFKNLLDVRIINRFRLDKETSMFVGDNRYRMYHYRFQKYIKYNANNFQLLFGNGKDTNAAEEAIFASYAMYIYEIGCIGFLIMISFLAYFLIYNPIKYKKTKIILLTILPILSFYQARGNIDFLIIIYSICLEYKLKNELFGAHDYV